MKLNRKFALDYFVSGTIL